LEQGPKRSYARAVATVDAVEALLSGKAFVDLSFWRKVAVSGPDALEWLNDLVSADITGVGPGRARRSVLLSPTGHLRAEFTVTTSEGVILLLQDPSQPDAIDALLARYVLSSQVELEDRTDRLALFAFPESSSPPDTARTWASVSSCTERGSDLLGPAEAHDTVLRALSERFTQAGNEDLERYRVVAGIPRFGVDATEDDLPVEGGLEDAVSFEKGCYLGQESVAKVRNLGHPRRVVVHLSAGAPVSAGDPVEARRIEAGRITSAAEHDGRWWALAKVRWDARDAALTTTGGVSLSPVAGS
jgi:folate-binding protein YgfZ